MRLTKRVIRGADVPPMEEPSLADDSAMRALFNSFSPEEKRAGDLMELSDSRIGQIVQTTARVWANTGNEVSGLLEIVSIVNDAKIKEALTGTFSLPAARSNHGADTITFNILTGDEMARATAEDADANNPSSPISNQVTDHFEEGDEVILPVLRSYMDDPGEPDRIALGAYARDLYKNVGQDVRAIKLMAVLLAMSDKVMQMNSTSTIISATGVTCGDDEMGNWCMVLDIEPTEGFYVEPGASMH